MASIQELGYPAKWLVRYINAELAKYDEIGMSASSEMMPIMPSTPTNIEEVYNNMIQTYDVGEPLLVQYDRLMRFRPNPLYIHKREQLILFLFTSNYDKMKAAEIIISQALDREDVSAQEVNKWMAENKTQLKPILGELNVFFRNMKVYQADETRDLVELASARTLYNGKLIVEYDYHVYKHDPEGQGLSPIYS